MKKTVSQHQSKTNPKVKVIYNPHAGSKRRVLPNGRSSTSLEDIKKYLDQYQIEADFVPTEYAGHATKLAQEAEGEGYKALLVAGGDGTVGEAANGLVNSNLTLGILPLGTFMNVAHMLSVPLDIEKAIMLIKIGKIRKIDVGAITMLSGKKLEKPYIFLESVGFGLEAQIHQHFLDFENGNLKAAIALVKTLFEYFSHKAEIKLDDHTVKTKATMINIANGPYSGAALPVAPDAKLNDHQLTISIFKMSNFDLVNYFLRLWMGFKRKKKPTIYTSKNVIVSTPVPRPVHADARVYGETPIEIEIIPNAISVYTGFADQTENIISFKKRTLLDP